MANADNCPNCDNIYGNEPRKIPCGHIVCHKCCLDLFDKENNTLVCPVCDKTHPFKSKNIFKKSLQQVAHSNFGKKTSTRDVSFASHMPMEKISGTEKASGKELKKVANHVSTPAPGGPPETAPINPLPPSNSPITVSPPNQQELVMNSSKTSMPPPIPLMESKSGPNKTKAPPSNSTSIPSLLQSVGNHSVSTGPTSDVVVARCHSCGDKCQVIVCEHCDHFVCLKCSEKHTASTKFDTQSLLNRWNECQQKREILQKKLNQYNSNRQRIDQELATIKVAVEFRTCAAIEAVIAQQKSLVDQIEKFIQQEKNNDGLTHQQLLKEFQMIEARLKSALNGEDIGTYSQDNFLRDIKKFQQLLNQRSEMIKNQTPRIPIITRYETVSIEKVLGELRVVNNFGRDPPSGKTNTSFNHQKNSRVNSVDELHNFTDLTPITNLSNGTSNSGNNGTINTNDLTRRDMTGVKPLMSEASPETVMDNFENFRRMAAQIHQLFNAPYSKVINAASSTTSNAPPPIENVHTNGVAEKSTRVTPLPNNNFVKSWKIEHTAVPNFLCMTPSPIAKVFVVDKFGKVSVGTIPPKSNKSVENHSLFAPNTDEFIESVVASSRFLIVYSRKKQDTMTGTMYFFTHDCKPVPPLNGIHQSIPVHHILCDQQGERLYCLDRMRCTIYYHKLPNNPSEIESFMKTRHDFIQFNPNFIAFKMLQNDTLLGFYVKNFVTVHLYDKQSAEKIDEIKCDQFSDKFESWGIIAIRKDNNTLVFKVDERGEQESASRQHIVYEVNRTNKQVISRIQLSSVFGMILGPSNEIILGIRQSKDSGVVQCYVKK